MMSVTSLVSAVIGIYPPSHWHSTPTLQYRFTFTQLDAGDPTREFSFALHVNEEDVYQVSEVVPSLDPSVVLEPLLENLNDTEDLSVFIRGMRNAFSATL